MRSLRFRLPALFLAGVVIAGVVTALLALRLFQNYTHNDTLATLRRQAAGLASLYADQGTRGGDQGRPAPRFAARLLERATGTRLYCAGVQTFPGQMSGLRQLDRSVVDWHLMNEGRAQTLEFRPPGTSRTYLAIAQPIELGGETFGALVVAKPRAELRSRWLGLFERVGLAVVAGLLVALALVWYFSRRVTGPLLALSRAADQVAEGKYGADLPETRPRDEIGHLADRFEQMTTRLAEAERRERNFIMAVSHELRTPLTAIRGHVEALSEGLARGRGERRASLEVLLAETERLERLVNDLLDLARLDAHRFTLTEQEVELRRLLERAYETYSEQARQRGIDYERVFEADPVLHTDGDRVLQIVSNLLDNAFAWTPDGGRIELGLEADNGSIAVSVADTGPGVAAHERDRIFRPFWSRSEDGSGAGLGLAIARELAHALGGELALDSTPGRGSRFELRLPAR